MSVKLPPATNVAAMKPNAGNQVPNRLPRGMADEIARYHTLIQCIRDVVGNQSAAQQRALTEHLEIIQPLVKGQAERATAVMARQIQSTVDRIEAVLFADANQKRNEPAK